MARIMPGAAIARTRRPWGHRGRTMRLDEIAREVLPEEVHEAVVDAMRPAWKGARLYMPARPAREGGRVPRGAADRFALELRAAIVDAGGTAAQADEILTALSAGYFWV